MPDDAPQPYTSTLDAFFADARDGGFTVSDDFAKPLIRQLRQLQDAFHKIGMSEILGSRAQLSDSPAAQWISQRIQQSAIGEQGMLPTVDHARTEMLEKVIEALNLARRRYTDSEESYAQVLNKQNGLLG
ncbi:hypothetical protein [Amycolatopsis lexingtonensis]|uniref:hypothetical protein n=1 Tax=Amycolatopsis lexingtonensis TaxID=218822 RepID=UPI003F7147CF